MAPIGAIGNYWAKPYRATEEEVKLLQSLADITAVTIENVKVYSELEQRVKERTRALEALNKELESFSYSVSHDLRAPLRAIMGYSKIAIEEAHDQLGESSKVALELVEQSARKMNELIDDLLKFSRLGHKQLEKSELTTEALVRSIFEELDRSVTHHAKIILNQLHNVRGDRALLYQVWYNLITNAVKYSSKKQHPEIEITSYKTENETVFSIKDNGVGFDMKFADKLFGAFQRLHSEREFKGTGIGLALVQRIINRHGGSVWAEAKVDEGATFSFSLPAESSD
jgi:light-regulated signal transduction histidine kinase (bacteriophytochrome)